MFTVGDKKISIISLLLVFLAILSLASTIFKPGIMSGYDTATHVINARLLSDALAEGQFPVRWTEWAWNGTSLPLFNFYQVGFYYLVAVIHLLVPSILTSVKLMVLLSWWGGAGLMFLLCRRFGTIPAALSALIYAFTPYLFTNIFIKATYPELLAMTFFIGFLWALDRLLVSGKSFYRLPLSLFLAALAISHLPTLIISIPLAIGYYLLLLGNHEIRMKSLWSLVFGLLLGLGMAAFYVLPAIIELPLVKFSNLTSEYYDFHLHFVYPQQLLATRWGYGLSIPGPNDQLSFQFGLIQWAIISLSVLLICIRSFNKYQIPNTKYQILRPHLIFWLMAIVYAVFFMHQVSLTFWENLKFIAIIQYPFRFLMVVTWSSAILSAILLSLVTKKWIQGLIVIISILAVFICYHSYLAPEQFWPASYFNIDSPAWKQSAGVAQKAILEKGYLPASVNEATDKKTKLSRWEIIDGQGQIAGKVIKNHQLILTVKANMPMTLRINTHYFPGWKVYVDNREVTINYSNQFGFMSFKVAVGSHEIRAQFTNTPIRTLADIITVVSFFGMIIRFLEPLFRKLRPLH